MTLFWVEFNTRSIGPGVYSSYYSSWILVSRAFAGEVKGMECHFC